MNDRSVGGVRRVVASRPGISVLLTMVLLALAVPVSGVLAGAVETDLFRLTVAPANQQIQPGGSTGYTVRAEFEPGFTEPVALAIDPAVPLPDGLSATFDPSTVTPAAPESALTITAAPTFSSSTDVSIVVRGTSGELTAASNAASVVQVSLVPRCLVDVTVQVGEVGAAGPVDGAAVRVGSVDAVPGAEPGTYVANGVGLSAGNAPTNVNVQASKDSPGTNKVGTYWPSSVVTRLVPPADIASCETGTRSTATVELDLERVLPASLSGAVFEGVVDAEGALQPTSTPVAGATATASGVGSATSGADGSFVFTDATTGAEQIHLNAGNEPLDAAVTVARTSPNPGDGYWPTTVRTGEMVPGGTYSVNAYVVKECAANLTVRAVDAVTEAPVPDVDLVIRTTDPTFNRAVRGDTGADGSLSRDLLFGTNNAPHAMRVSASGRGYVSQSNVMSEVLSCGAASTLDVVLQPTPGAGPPAGYSSVTGIVRDAETGAPVAGVDVSFSPCVPRRAQDCASAPTDAEGRYSVTDIPIGNQGEPVTSVAGSVTAISPLHYAESADVTATIGAQVTAPDLELVPRRYGAISGVVRDSLSEDPLPGASVTVRSTTCPDTSSQCATTTDADGAYAVDQVTLGPDNAPVQRRLLVSLPGYWTKQIDVPFVDGVPTVQDVELVEECEGGTVVGTVTSSATGNPIEGVVVSTQDTSSVTTDEDGSFTLSNVPVAADNAPRLVAVRFDSPAYYPLTQQVTVECGKTTTLSPDLGATTTTTTAPTTSTTTTSSTSTTSTTTSTSTTTTAPTSTTTTTAPTTSTTTSSTTTTAPTTSTSTSSTTTTLPVQGDDSVTVRFTGSLEYRNEGTGLGDLVVERDGFGVREVRGSLSIAGADGGRADVTINASRAWILPLWVGELTVVDPAAGLDVRVPVFGQLEDAASGSVRGRGEWFVLGDFPALFRPFSFSWSVTDGS